jgi:DNA-binding HxlR family transcriptional regulator
MTKRQYDQYCPVATGLDIVGERWALLIVRELLLGGKRFADLEAGLPGVGTNTLTTRLADLVDAGVIARRRLAAPAGTTIYELTPWGRELEPIIYAVARWSVPLLGTASPSHPLQAGWLGVALKAFFERPAARGLTTTIELLLPSGALTVAFRRGQLDVREEPAAAPALRMTSTEPNVVALLSGDPAASARARKAMRIEGDASLLERFVAAFPLGLAGAADRA